MLILRRIEALTKFCQMLILLTITFEELMTAKTGTAKRITKTNMEVQ